MAHRRTRRFPEMLMPGERRFVESFGKSIQNEDTPRLRWTTPRPARDTPAAAGTTRFCPMKALLLIDLQNDFLPGGPMGVPDGDAMLPLVQQLQGQFRLVVATQDWHPANHANFAANHTAKNPGEIARLRRGLVLLRPVHCVQNTRGAELAPALNRERINRIFRTGADTNLDSFSAFFDGDHQTATGLGDYFRDKKVKEIFLCGLGAETTILNTALDALGFEFKPVLIEDACRGGSPEAATKAIEEMKAAGVAFVNSREVLSWSVRQ